MVASAVAVGYAVRARRLLSGRLLSGRLLSGRRRPA